MKKNIHPKYYDSAEVICNCGNKFYIGSTLQSIKIEVCSKCHPFFTGQIGFIDIARRVERFKEKLEKTEKIKKEKSKKKRKKATKI